MSKTNSNLVVMKTSDFDADEMFFRADQLINDKKVKEAVELLNEIIAKYPDYGRAYNHLGWVYEVKFGNYVEAKKFYEKSLELDPNYKAIYNNYAICLRDCGDLEKAMDVADRGLKVQSTYKPSLYSTIGTILEQQGKLDDALFNFKEALRLSLDLTEAYRFQDSIKRCGLKKEALK